jgi:hypothetical protein
LRWSSTTLRRSGLSWPAGASSHTTTSAWGFPATAVEPDIGVNRLATGRAVDIRATQIIAPIAPTPDAPIDAVRRGRVLPVPL